jgi:hypothetical protein
VYRGTTAKYSGGGLSMKQKEMVFAQACQNGLHVLMRATVFRQDSPIVFLMGFGHGKVFAWRCSMNAQEASGK